MDPPATHLDDQVNQWLTATPEQQVNLWHELVHPESRGLVHGCRLAIAKKPHAVDSWMGRSGLLTDDSLLAFAGRGAVLSAVRAHLLCVQMARNPLHWTQLQRVDARASTGSRPRRTCPARSCGTSPWSCAASPRYEG